MNCSRSRMSTFFNSLKKSTFLDTSEKSTFLDGKSLLFRIWPNIESLLFWTPKSRLFWTVLECRIPKVYFFGCNPFFVICILVCLLSQFMGQKFTNWRLSKKAKIFIFNLEHFQKFGSFLILAFRKFGPNDF